jgi:hypothetical protein
MMVSHLIELTQNKEVTPQVQAVAMLKLEELNGWIAKQTKADAKDKAHYLFIKKQIESLKTNENINLKFNVMTPPDGQPIDPGYDWLSPDCEWIERR